MLPCAHERSELDHKDKRKQQPVLTLDQSRLTRCFNPGLVAGSKNIWEIVSQMMTANGLPTGTRTTTILSFGSNFDHSLRTKSKRFE